MRLLDCGSGPGTITAGLARVVGPGKMERASATVQAHGDSASTAAQGDVAAALLEHMAPTISASGWATWAG